MPGQRKSIAAPVSDLPSGDLTEAALAYDRAEITCFIVEDRGKKEFLNLLTLIELVPTEQEDAELIGSGQYPYQVRETSDHFNFYMIRIPDLPVSDLINIYRHAGSGILLDFKGVKVAIRIQAEQAENPPGEYSILVNPQGEKTLGAVLPHRNTNCRIWSKLNTNKEWLNDFDQRFFKKISAISKRYLGYDLSAIPEHIGNVYLFAGNPILRSWDSLLLDLEKEILVQFYERELKTVLGCTLVLEEERAGNKGFYIRHPIVSHQTKILLPYFPDILHMKLLDPSGHLIDYAQGIWRNWRFNLNIQEKIVEYRIQTDDGTLTYSIPKRSAQTPVNIGEFDLSVAHYLKEASGKRRFEELEQKKEFIFFPKQHESKAKAQQIVRAILNKASTRCMILDPYFGAKDLLYAFHIENISVPVQIISSGHFLKGSAVLRVPDSYTPWQKLWVQVKEIIFPSKPVHELTHAENLSTAIRSYEKTFPLQKIECKVLRGSPSPLHDRFIIIDDDVYLLGSSLNEFGNRTTTIIKVPTPDGMIAHALEWWNDDTTCPELKTFVEDLTGNNGKG